MDAAKPAGWYYVGQGKLRYRDEVGWTDYYMATDDPRTREWPPPSPEEMVSELRESLAEPGRHRSQLGETLRGLVRRGHRSAGKHRATA